MYLELAASTRNRKKIRRTRSELHRVLDVTFQALVTRITNVSLGVCFFSFYSLHGGSFMKAAFVGTGSRNFFD